VEKLGSPSININAINYPCRAVICSKLSNSVVKCACCLLVVTMYSACAVDTCYLETVIIHVTYLM